MTTSHERTFDDLRSTLGDYARIVRQRWRLGFVALGIVSSLAFWYSQYLPRCYHADTVFERRDDVVLRNLVHGNSPYSFDNLKSTLVLDMSGSRALAEAATQLGLLPADILPPQGALSNDVSRALDAALARYQLTATVQVLQSSAGLDTIRLSCEANHPEIAQRFAVALRDGYISKTRDRISEILWSTREFFEAELNRLRQQATETDRTLREQFKDFPGVDPTDLASVGARLETLRQEQMRLASHESEVEAQVGAREEFLASTAAWQTGDAPPVALAANVPAPPTLPDSDETLSRAIRDVETQVAEKMIVLRMTDQHPTIQGLRRKLDGLCAARDGLRARLGSGASAADEPAASARARPAPSAERLRVELELEALRRQFSVVKTTVEEADRRTERLDALYTQLLSHGDELREVQEKLGQDTATIAMWRQHLGQLDRILSAESGERGTQFVLVEEPKDDGRAVSPRLASVFSVCTGAGLAVAALAVALVELLDRSFRSAGQVTRVLGLPVLECIGVIATPQVRRRRLISRLVWGPALGLLFSLLVVAGGLAYISLAQPGLHRQAVAKLNHTLRALGAPGTELPGQSEK